MNSDENDYPVFTICDVAVTSKGDNIRDMVAIEEVVPIYSSTTQTRKVSGGAKS